MDEAARQGIIESGTAMVEQWAGEAKRSMQWASKARAEVNALRESGGETIDSWKAEARMALWALRAIHLAEGTAAASHLVQTLKDGEEPDDTERELAAETVEMDAACQMMLAILGQTGGLDKDLQIAAPMLRQLPFMLASGAAGMVEVPGSMGLSPDALRAALEQAVGGSVADEAEEYLKGEGEGYL